MFPTLIDLPFLTLYAYPLFMGIAWGVSYVLAQYFLDKKQIDSSSLKWLYLGVFLFAWIGAKVFFLIFTSGDQMNLYLKANAFWLGGGFVFYGGLIFGLLFFLFYSLILKKFDINDSYVFIPSVAIGHAIGRIGCFLAGCCYGSVCHLPWSVHMHGRDIHPVQLYESFLLMGLGALSIWAIKKEIAGYKIVLSYLISYSIVRFIVEFFRGDLIRGIYWMGLSTSQMVSIALVIAATVTWIYLLKTKENKKRQN